MLTFLTELWESIFTPGTTPTLVLATHATFGVLVLTLSIFAFLSKSIHIINLLVLSLVLWGILTWFINELDTIQAVEEKAVEAVEEKNKETAPEPKAQTTSARVTRSATQKKRKA